MHKQIVYFQTLIQENSRLNIKLLPKNAEKVDLVAILVIRLQLYLIIKISRKECSIKNRSYWYKNITQSTDLDFLYPTQTSLEFSPLFYLCPWRWSQQSNSDSLKQHSFFGIFACRILRETFWTISTYIPGTFQLQPLYSAVA